MQCVHPILTLWEKLDAIARRYDRPAARFDPTSFVRHYEDIARIILRENEFSLTNATPSSVREALLKGRHIHKTVTATDDSLVLSDQAKRAAVTEAYDALRPMYWQDQMPLEDALQTITHWLGQHP